MNCPNCGNSKTLILHDKGSSMRTFKCRRCKRIILLKKERGTWELIVEGVSVAAGLISIAGFLGIKDIDDLSDILS